MVKDGSIKDVLPADEVRDVLESTFFQSAESDSRSRKRKKRRSVPKPDHYDVICISMYKEDLCRLDNLVRELKSSGHRKMSRSALIRYALDTVDVSNLPKAY